MPTLTQLFDAQRDAWQQRLGDSPSPAHALRESKMLLDTLQLHYLEQEHCGLNQRRLTPFLLDTLKASLASLCTLQLSLVPAEKAPASHKPQPATTAEASRHVPLPSQRSANAQSGGFWSSASHYRQGQLLVLAVLVLWLLARGELFALLLSLGLVGSEALRLLPGLVPGYVRRVLGLRRLRNPFAADSQDNSQDSQAPAKRSYELASAKDGRANTANTMHTTNTTATTAAWQHTLYTDSAALAVCLVDALHTVDKVLAEVEQLYQPAMQQDSALSSPSLLAFLQDMLEAQRSNDSSYALRKARHVPALLAEYDIQVLDYQGDNGAYFEFLPSLDPEQRDYRTLSPALLHEQQLLSRGRASEPQSGLPSAAASRLQASLEWQRDD